MSMYDGINLTVAFLVSVVAPVGTVFYVVHAVRHRGWRAFGASLWHVLAVVLAGSWTVLVAAWKTIGWIMPEEPEDDIKTTAGESRWWGAWNFRTGKADDGADPAGLYGRDIQKPKY